MTKYINIQVDTNDADYVERKSTITDEEIELIKPVIEAVKNFQSYKTNNHGLEYNHSGNFPYGECCRKRLGEKTARELYGHLEGYENFLEFIPSNEHGFHTIQSVEILVIEEQIKLL